MTVVAADKPRRSPLDHLNFVDAYDGVRVPYCGGVHDDGSN